MSSPGDAMEAAGIGPGAPSPAWHRSCLPGCCDTAAAVAQGMPPLPGCIPTAPARLVALRMYPVSLLPRDRLIEQLYGEIAALKEELENFKAEVGDNNPVVSRGERPCGSPEIGRASCRERV